MSAAESLKAARAAGIQLGVDGENLTLEAAVAPPVSVLDLLSRNKAAVMALLRASFNGWSAEEWRAFYDERAAIAEFDGGLPRQEAESVVFDCRVVEWLSRIRCARFRAAVMAAGEESVRATCCPLAPKSLAIAGCTRAAGLLGTQAVRPRLSMPWQQWGFALT
jgi:hypothetical protein